MEVFVDFWTFTRSTPLKTFLFHEVQTPRLPIRVQIFFSHFEISTIVHRDELSPSKAQEIETNSVFRACVCANCSCVRLISQVGTGVKYVHTSVNELEFNQSPSGFYSEVTRTAPRMYVASVNIFVLVCLGLCLSQNCNPGLSNTRRRRSKGLC